MVRGRGFEPPWVTPLAPKASASTVSPPARCNDDHTILYIIIGFVIKLSASLK